MHPDHERISVLKVTATSLPEVLVIEPDVFRDKRGYFEETYHVRRYREFGMGASFVQDNVSFSSKGTLRGLHFQYPFPQAKLVQVLRGEVFDVAVDIRRGSPTFGRWTGIRLTEINMKQLYIPEGFAHGFCVMSDHALFIYKCSNFYNRETERGILWNDPDLDIDWPVKEPVISEKDGENPLLKDLPDEFMPLSDEE